MSCETLKNLYDKIESYRDAMVEMQRGLIPTRAISPASGGTGEMEKARYLEPFLKDIFNEILWINVTHPETGGVIRPNIVCTLKGKDASRTIWFMVHMDVVPEGDIKKWETPPFEAVVKGDKLFGRGSEDNHQSLVSTYFAIKAIRGENISPPCNVGVIFVSDEESGSNYGLKYILKARPDLFREKDMFIVPDSGSPGGDTVEIAEKGISRFRLTFTGKQAHAFLSYKGINANRMASYFVVRLDEMRKKYFNKENPLFDPPYCTAEPTEHRANNVSGNTIPSEEIQTVDCRILPDYDFEDFCTKLTDLAKKTAKEFGGDVKVEPLVVDPPAPITPANAPILESLKKAVHEVLGVGTKTVGVGGGTVARFLRYKGFNVVLWQKNEETLHGPNEYCVITNMVDEAKVFANLILNI